MIVPSMSALKICSWKLDFWCGFISRVARYHLFSSIFHWVIAAGLASMSKQLGKTVSYCGQTPCCRMGRVIGYSRCNSIMLVMTLQKQEPHPRWLVVPSLGHEWLRNHIGLRLESCERLGQTGLAEAALKLSMRNCICARLSLFTRGCTGITLIRWQLTQ